MEKGSIVLLHRRDSIETPFTQEPAFVAGETSEGLSLIAFKQKEVGHLSGPDWPLAFERLTTVCRFDHEDVLAGRVRRFYSEIADTGAELSKLSRYIHSHYPSVIEPEDTAVGAAIRMFGILERQIDALSAPKEMSPAADPTQATASDSSESPDSTSTSGPSTASSETTLPPPAETATT